MALKTNMQVQYRYKIEMIYLNIKNNKNTNIKTECIKSIIIDHNYEDNCMPIIYATMKLDKALVDDMILNTNKNLIIVALYKYNDLTDTKEPIEVFRDKFTYFIPNDVNKNLNLDYNESTQEEYIGNTYTEVIMGLMSINMININKRNIELNVSNNTIFDCVKYCTSNIKNLIIEPFIFDNTYDRIIMPAQNSINNALKFLNNYRVFYYTPYRYYQDFNYTYIISSSGKAIPKYNELYSSILVDFRDTGDANSLEVGTIIDSKSKTYQVPVNYTFSNVFDNTTINKSINKIKSVSNNKIKTRQLVNNADYSSEKITTVRMNNDNDNMVYNLEYKNNSNNIFIYFSKNDLDTELFTINKRITVHNINRYSHYNGDYLLSRKRECYMRENDTFVMISMINLRKIEPSNDIEIEKYNI